MTLDGRDKQRIAEHWGEAAPDLERSFYGFPFLRDYLLSCLTGEHVAPGTAKADFFERWTVEHALEGPANRCLSLCCGFGRIERRLARLGAFRHCTALDISPGAVQAATAAAADAGLTGIEYRVADLAEADLGVEQYDLVWANGALHHIEDLEGLARKIYDALVPGGLFVCNEYIGPKYQALSPEREAIVNAAMHLIPERLRGVTVETFVPPRWREPVWRRRLYQFARAVACGDNPLAGALKARPRHAALRAFAGVMELHPLRKKAKRRFGPLFAERSEQIRANDPSECIRSDEIVPVLSEVFDGLDVRHYNGGILVYALDSAFYERFDASRDEDARLLEMLIGLERDMTGAGLVPSDHAHILARKS